MQRVILILGLATCLCAWAKPAADYLPADANLDPAVPTPEEILGWEVGDWWITHDQLVTYMYAVANASDRVSIEVIGRTHEQRPMLQLIFTAPENRDALEQMRQSHLAVARGERDDSTPLVVWLGQSIHGNEASGSNAAPLIAYYLAASGSDFVVNLLKQSVVLLDPSFNPDGMQRFSTWSNANRSKHPVADRNHRIHNEDWPQNRTNHYLFDLNRDWLPLVHPESRARVAELHRWLPHVLTDQHEAGSATGYFFQPGVPERQNPLLPAETLEMHRKLGAYHAEAMDQAGEPIYTEDSFDDFYIGKGSTYTDINGVIGILFEQPRINGPEVESPIGPMTFKRGISNQLRTTLSTLRGAHALRDDLIEYQKNYFDIMAERAREAGFDAWVIGDDGDPERARVLMDVFRQHQIEFKLLDEALNIDGQRFEPGHAFVLPTRQRQFALLQGMMERRTQFKDETFYDVSAWTHPLAYNLPYARAKRMPDTRAASLSTEAGSLPKPSVAWLIPWGQLRAPALLQALLEAGARVQAATTPFTARTSTGERSFLEGTLQLHVATQKPAALESIEEILTRAAQSGLDVHSATSSLTPDGQDLGNRDFAFLEPVRPLLLSGPGTSAYDVGEVWHHLDTRLGFAPVMVNIRQLGGIRLSEYTHLVMTSASYEGLGKAPMKKVAAWVKEGGILIAMGKAATRIESICFKTAPDSCQGPAKDPAKDTGKDTAKNTGEEKAEGEAARRNYADFDKDFVQQIVGGAVVAATLDRTHPLGFGYRRDDLAIFRRGTVVLKPSDNAYSTPLRFTDQPLLSGFMGPDRLEDIQGQAAVIAERQGRGLVIRFSDNPLFRGFWRGTERLFENSLYFGQTVRTTRLPR